MGDDRVQRGRELLKFAGQLESPDDDVDGRQTTLQVNTGDSAERRAHWLVTVIVFCLCITTRLLLHHADN